MLRAASILSTLLLQIGCGLSPGSGLKTPTDDVRRVAQDLRWTRQNRAIASINTADFAPPVTVLAVPPGTHALRDLESLVQSEQAREWLRRITGGGQLTTDNATLYIFGARQMTSAFLQDEASIPKPVGLWKERAGDVEVLLERQGDEVQIVGLQ